MTNNEDSENLGRIKVKFPWLNDDAGEVESCWARIATPDAGPERGFMWLPEVNDEVLVSFEHGDVNRPFVLGGLWNGKSKPPKKNSEAVSAGTVNERIIRSRSGHVIILDDTDGSEKITIQDKTQKNEIIIDSSANTLTINIDKDITIEAGAKVTVKSAQDMSFESQTNLNIKAGANCTIEATGNMSLKGTQLSAEGTAQAELKAPMVSVNGSATTEVRGGLVRIN